VWVRRIGGEVGSSSIAGMVALGWGGGYGGLWCVLVRLERNEDVFCSAHGWLYISFIGRAKVCIWQVSMVHGESRSTETSLMLSSFAISAFGVGCRLDDRLP
jgi:hypothetical protein